MKTFIWTIVCLCCCLLATAQTKYEVTTNTFLNIRSYADINAPILGTISKGNQVNVYELSDGWAKIEYDNSYAYVSAKYLKEVDSSSANIESSTKFELPSWNLSLSDVKWMIYPILALSLILFFIRIRREDDPLEGAMYFTNWLIFLAVSTLELIYLVLINRNPVWFCVPDTVGWIWTIINFLIFGFIVYNQLMCFFNTLLDVEYNSYSSFEKRWGIYSWIGGPIAGIVTGIVFPPLAGLVVIAFIVCQIIQVVLIFRGIVPKGGWGNAFLYLAIYLLGALSTILILVHFVVLLIIVLIGYLILSMIGQGSRNSSTSSGNSSTSTRYCNSCNYCRGDYCIYHNGPVNDIYHESCSNYSN